MNSATRTDLQPFKDSLDDVGYAVVPPEVTGLTPEKSDRLLQLLLDKSKELVGCNFTVENGPECEIDFGDYKGTLERQSRAKPSQFQLMQLCTFDRAFRDLAVNAVAIALMDHLFGESRYQTSAYKSATRFSSHNCFIKWAGEGYGASLGLHCDQGAVPLPWGKTALNANCNWCLTDYTLANGAFACVPGSHKRNAHPKMPEAVAESIPIECPRGSLIAFHGALWHGAFPRTAPGLRVTIANYYRHVSIQPQDDIPNHFPKELADDCDDPDLFRHLAGFGSPYQSQVLPVPKAVRA